MMDMKQGKPGRADSLFICKNNFKESSEDEKGKLFTAKWIKVVEECEKKKLYN